METGKEQPGDVGREPGVRCPAAKWIKDGRVMSCSRGQGDKTQTSLFDISLLLNLTGAKLTSCCSPWFISCTLSKLTQCGSQVVHAGISAVMGLAPNLGQFGKLFISCEAFLEKVHISESTILVLF